VSKAVNVLLLDEPQDAPGIDDDDSAMIDNLTLYTDKQQYVLGEIVYIYSDANMSSLRVYHDNTSFLYTGPSENMSFAPPNAGDYRIEAMVFLWGVAGTLETNAR